MKETIANVKYLQDKANGVKYYAICKSEDVSFWIPGQIIAKFKDATKATFFKRKNLLSEYIAIKDIEAVISGAIHK